MRRQETCWTGHAIGSRGKSLGRIYKISQDQQNEFLDNPEKSCESCLTKTRLMRAIPTLKISISGVRGVVGQSLTPKLLTRFAQAFGTHTGSGTIVIGRDPRTSGEMVKHAVVAGLLSTGSRVVDIGVCPVPTVQLQVRHRRAQGGIAITASHNPAEWNALKFISSTGLFLDSGQARALLDI